jgi:hypothetical protein
MLQHIEPLLCNDGEMAEYTRDVSGQGLGKHVPAATETSVTIEYLCSLCGPCRDIKQGTSLDLVWKWAVERPMSCTVTLPVVGGD